MKNINEINLKNPDKIYHSNTTGDFKIIGKVKTNISNTFQTRNDTNRFFVKFVNTGNITDASRTAICRGRVKDYMYPTIANIGCIGADIKITKDPYYHFYKPWNDMMNRCYNPIDKDYQYYGNLGIKVDERWHNFYQYYLDIQRLEGIEKKLQYPLEYQLDKDYKQLYIPKEQRIYSKETCIWLSRHDNNYLMNVEYSLRNGLYFGVLYKDNSFVCRIQNHIYGRFNNIIAAANMYNYMYPLVIMKHNIHANIFISNNVEIIPYDELINYAINKNEWFNDYPTWSTIQANWK